MGTAAILAGISVIVPAAGMGTRFGADVPKQYLPLSGRPVLEHTLERLLALGPAQLILAVAPGDPQATQLAVASRCRIVEGGKERSDSVLAGLNQMAVNDSDWVMVHDGVRPCFRTEDIQALVEVTRADDVGGLLAVPVTDTVKRAVGGQVQSTVDREDLWLAQTPQLFRFGVLKQALDSAPVSTDEASAVEALGLFPKIVEGHRSNIKITVPADLALAAYYLAELS